jgi:hypothetical protein
MRQPGTTYLGKMFCVRKARDHLPGFCLSHEANYTRAAHQTKAQALFRQRLRRWMMRGFEIETKARFAAEARANTDGQTLHQPSGMVLGASNFSRSR